MPNRINKGPEVYSPDELHIEYSRSERMKMNTFTDGRSSSSKRTFSIRILMMDLLLLCIIGGVIYPFILTSNKRGTLEGLKCELSLRSLDEDLYLSVLMRNQPEGLSPRPVEIEFLINGQSVKKVNDLTPPTGEDRIFRFRLKRGNEKISVRVGISIEESRIELNAISPVPR
ncbi:hypothetical protein [Oceanispirochaeta sp.]|jgi:hypothetical protein|uniref:hypothetical protein n=1 Tax=Oceanispirochaeta sp. TaxID=2035350 RepID=UPI00260CEEA3|nr:hypothetical protein [Oceanispirochaeta sp.]MDA3957235.1 hypothetical protein [Oceanispirochaeta sp.]